jgi:hypothetical protein
MREDFDTIEAFEPAELGEEMLDLVSGGTLPDWDPNG